MEPNNTIICQIFVLFGKYVRKFAGFGHFICSCERNLRPRTHEQKSPRFLQICIPKRDYLPENQVIWQIFSSRCTEPKGQNLIVRTNLNAHF